MTTAGNAFRISLGLAIATALSACAGAGPVREAPTAHAGHGGRASEPMAPSPFVVPLDAATLSKLPRETVQAAAHGQSLDCEGVALDVLLRAAGALPADELPGPQLARYVLVDARDGYRALYSLAELDPGTGRRNVLLADRCNGAALGDEDGPLRLIAPEDARPARWVRQVTCLRIARHQ